VENLCATTLSQLVSVIVSSTKSSMMPSGKPRRMHTASQDWGKQSGNSKQSNTTKQSETQKQWHFTILSNGKQ
jgi:hypothetical protein